MYCIKYQTFPKFNDTDMIQYFELIWSSISFRYTFLIIHATFCKEVHPSPWDIVYYEDLDEGVYTNISIHLAMLSVYHC